MKLTLDAMSSISDVIPPASKIRSRATLTAVSWAGRSTVPNDDLNLIASSLGLEPVTMSIKVPDDRTPGRDSLDWLLRAVSQIGGAWLIGPSSPQRISPGRATKGNAGPLLRALIPVEDGHRASAVPRKVASVLSRGGAEVEILHVFTDESRPLFWGSRDYEEAWKRQFLTRYCTEAVTRFHLRSGRVHEQIERVVEEGTFDVVVADWNGNPEPDRSPVLRMVLRRSTVPVVIIPVTSKTVGWVSSKSRPARTRHLSSAPQAPPRSQQRASAWRSSSPGSSGSRADSGPRADLPPQLLRRES